MRFLNFGSLNLDYTYFVDHIVQPGETLASSSLEVFPGGKGLNQSVALARAGAEVYHAGMVGPDGSLLRKVLQENGIHTEYVRTVQERSGNAIIQVSRTGENSILLFGGANRCNTEAFVRDVLSGFGTGDWLLLQNEINLLPYLVKEAHSRGIRIALNPSPYDAQIEACDLGKVNLFFINEVEGCQITNETEPEKILAAMEVRFPKAEIVLTLGAEGAVLSSRQERYYCDSVKVNAVDTTAAGDTFTGYFLQSYLSMGQGAAAALQTAAKAAAISVTRKGAVPSIPTAKEV